MNIKDVISSSLFLRGIFVVSLFALLYISSVSYKHTTALSESSDLLVHSYKIHFELEHVINSLKDAETMQRGFIITQDSTFIEPFIADQNAIYKSYLTIKSLTADDRKQQYNLDTLLQLIEHRFELMKLTLQTVSTNPVDEKQLDNNLFRGKEINENLLKQINKMYELEMKYFNLHRQKYEQEVVFTPFSTLFIMLFSLLIFTLSFLKINKDLTAFKKSNEKLLITTESMKHAETIGKFCISQLDLVTRELTFSDNFYRLLGCEPQSFEATIDNYLEFVHPDDKHIVAKGTENLFSEGSVHPRFYRIIRKDGKLRYFEFIGKFLPEINSKQHIGIIKDITEYHLSRIALEERNVELEQSIRELESFNRVASHDLQEPLRKIQTFISRIPENDRAVLSDTSQEYLFKIESFTNRMRILIDDLLLFSRATKAEKVFEKSNLNLILEAAKQELAQDIDDKNAVIQSAQLPVLNVISFQIKQLFVNLIGNALKYSKPGVPPLITISCEKLAARDYPGFITDKHKKYYKIAISDNGMGFEQEYAEKIFILFNRLHQKTEYPGSGIGLTICKKIAENHNGFIIAEGKPDIGATFTLFLPA
jgi:PAS domain S-box-containing protein